MSRKPGCTTELAGITELGDKAASVKTYDHVQAWLQSCSAWLPTLSKIYRMHKILAFSMPTK
jgi:exoribonuclease II